MNTNPKPNSTAGTSSPVPARFIPVRCLAICAVALCLSANLSAETVQMVFDGVNGTEAFGYYLSPYYGTMDATPVNLICVDFANEVQIGEQWEANLTPLTAGADLSGTRWGAEPGALSLYEQAAWLSLQFASQPVSQYADIQATIWQLFYSAAPSPGSSFWLQDAQSNYASAGYQGFAIITNTGPVEQSGQVQEFLTQLSPKVEFQPFGQIQSNVTPEPATNAMIGLALVCAGWACRRRRAQP